MKITSEDLMKAMGLKVGDRVKFIVEDTYIGVVGFYGNTLSFIVENKNENETSPIFDLSFIIHKEIDFELLPQPKRVGDLKCEGKCPSCPCIYVCNEEVNAVDKTLYEVLELGIATFTKIPKKINEAIYDVIKTNLDKEVEE